MRFYQKFESTLLKVSKISDFLFEEHPQDRDIRATLVFEKLKEKKYITSTQKE